MSWTFRFKSVLSSARAVTWLSIFCVALILLAHLSWSLALPPQLTISTRFCCDCTVLRALCNSSKSSIRCSACERISLCCLSIAVSYCLILAFKESTCWSHCTRRCAASSLSSFVYSACSFSFHALHPSYPLHRVAFFASIRHCERAKLSKLRYLSTNPFFACP